jgi:PKD repeat protein
MQGMNSPRRALGALTLVLCIAGAQVPPSLAGASVPADAPALLDGTAAVAELGSALPAVAKAYGMSSSELEHELLEDESLKLDASNRLMYHDTDLMHSAQTEPELTAATTSGSWAYGGIDYTASDAFALSSRPSSPVTIYLDFNGHTTTNTYWNNSYGASIVSRPLDLDNNPSTFSVAERTTIGQTWAAVAEDFAPWDVNVTTVEPIVSDLIKTNASDTRFGIRVVTTPDAFISAGGVAYLNSITWASDTPAFCFGYNYGANNMALVISHEVGHAFNLNHDGTASQGYYGGHGSWGPIMGAPYGKTITQWSKGEYTSANNKEDDLTQIASITPLAADDFTDNMADAVTLQGTSVQGRISTASDKDWFKFSVASGNLGVTVQPGFIGNLDPVVQLWKDGSLVGTASGAGAVSTTFSSLSPGEYRLMVDGEGYGLPASTGYSEYGSIGNYLLTISGDVSVDPPAQITVVPSSTNAIAGSSVSFSVTSSTHPTLSGVSLAWSFSNGSTGSGTSATVTMPSSSLTASVTATTASRAVTVASVQVRLSKAPSASAAVTPASTYAGNNVVFSATATDPDTQALSYAWSFSDGTTATGVTATKTSRTVGTLTGTVTVTDADGNTATASKSASFLANLPPTVTATASKTTAPAPATITFTALGVDPERTAVSYLWTFPDGSNATIARPSVTFTEPGTKTVTVKATDAAGFHTTKTVTVTITSNNAPVVTSASVSKATAPAPARLTFTTVASDPDKQVLTYAWVFSDGQTGTGAALSKTFTSAGSYTATVTATDPGGLSASKTVSFIVSQNRAPSVTIKAIRTTTQVAPASFSVAAIGLDADNQTLTYRWELSDGTSATTATLAKKLATTGTITATVTVTDPGGLTASASVTLTATQNNAPTVSITHTGSLTKVAPALFSLSAAGVDQDKQALTYAWTFSDGTKATTANVSKRWITAGTYTASVTVTDTGGLSATSSVTITVTANTAPSVSAVAVSAASAPSGTSRVFSSTVADPDNQTLTYKWVFGDGSTSANATVTKSFSTKGTFTATLTVTDTGGLTSSRSISYVVS